MGDWSVYCGVSRIAITSGSAVLIPLKPNSELDAYDKYVPATLPIFGEYNTYGGIEDIIEDENTALIEKAYNCTIQEFCDFITENRRDYDDEYSEWHDKENLKELENITYMWVKGEVWDFLKNLRPDAEGRVGHSFSFGDPQILKALGFEYVGKTKDSRYTDHYRYSKDGNLVNLASDGRWVNSLDNKDNYIFDIKDLKNLGVDTTQFEGKEEHNMYSILDAKTRIERVANVIGIPRDYKMVKELLSIYKSKVNEDPEILSTIADLEKRKNLGTLINSYLDKIGENGDIIKIMADLKTVKNNMRCASTSWEPYIVFTTPQYGEFQAHQLMLEGFAAINKSLMNEYGDEYDEDEDDEDDEMPEIQPESYTVCGDTANVTIIQNSQQSESNKKKKGKL